MSQKFARALVATTVYAMFVMAPTPASDLPSLDARAFGTRVVVEIVPMATPAQSRDALVGAIEEINRIEALTRLERADALVQTYPANGVAALNRAAGRGPVTIDPHLLEVLERALAFCSWSQGAYGPLGGRLNELWGVHQPAAARPSLTAMQIAAGSASCDRLSLDQDSRRATLAEGSVVDLWGFARGFAVDRSVAVLEAAGAEAGWVQIGQVTRTFGPGPRGGGWPMLATPLLDQESSSERVLLHDRAIAMASAQAGTLHAGETTAASYVSHRSGRSIKDTTAVLVVTELAVDAEGLASTLFVIPNREGEFRLGSLRPAPAVKWFLGGGTGRSLATERGWAELQKWLPPQKP